jgi:hypothetical protein
MGASVAMATAVSAGAFTSPPAPTAPPVAVRVAVPIVATPVEPIETVAASTAPVAGDAQHPAGTPPATPAAAPSGLPVLGSLPCTLGNLSKVLQPPAAGAATTPAVPTPGSGNLLSELLSPVNSLSPVLACDPTLAHVGVTLQALAGRKPSGAQPPPQGAGAPAVQGLDLIRLLQQLLGLTSPAH